MALPCPQRCIPLPASRCAGSRTASAAQEAHPSSGVRCFMGVSLCRRGWRLAECGPGRPSPVPPAPGDSAGNAGSKSQLSIHTVSLSGVAKPHRSQQMRCQGLSKSNEDILIGREMPSVYGLPPGEAGQSRTSLCTGFLGRCPLAASCPPAPSLLFLPIFTAELRGVFLRRPGPLTTPFPAFLGALPPSLTAALRLRLVL